MCGTSLDVTVSPACKPIRPAILANAPLFQSESATVELVAVGGNVRVFRYPPKHSKLTNKEQEDMIGRYSGICS
jgi:hypothetical protein